MIAKLAKEHNVGNSTLTDLKKNESKIPEFMTTMESLTICPKGQKIIHLAKDGQLDEALYLWYVSLISHINFSQIWNGVGPNHFG